MIFSKYCVFIKVSTSKLRDPKALCPSEEENIRNWCILEFVVP